MHQDHLVSIIIPVFNREDLIIETLDSIVSQTYKNWECILVDDGSMDRSMEVISAFAKADSRIIFFKRPANRLKGANACRNIGLEKAKGDYIIFFDSDDLMTPDHVAVKAKAILLHQKDYIITRTKFFNASNERIDRYYNFKDYDITAFHYITQKINWLTYDTIIKSDLAKSIRFNEILKSGQEYNYFSKLVITSNDAIFVDKVVTMRRMHDKSIRAHIKSLQEIKTSLFLKFWHTYLDIKKLNSDKKNEQFLIGQCIDCIFILRTNIAQHKFKFLLETFKTLGYKGCYFLLLLVSMKYNKGYVLRNKLVRAYCL